MKRTYILTALVVLLSGCANDDFLGSILDNGMEAISLGGESMRVTRADVGGATAAADLGNNFVVAGYRQIGEDGGTGTTIDCIFDHYNVNFKESSAKSTASNTKGWEYVGQTKNSLSSAEEQTIKYWDPNSDKYYFVAFSKGNGVSTDDGTGTPVTNYATFGKVTDPAVANNNWTNGSDPLDAEHSAFTISGTVDVINSAYFADLVSVTKASYGQTVTPKFRRVGAKVRIALYETIPGYSVKDVKFYTADNTLPTGDAAKTPTLYASGNIFPSGDGTIFVGYPNRDDSEGANYLKAVTLFKATEGSSTQTSLMQFSPLSYGLTAKEKKEAETDDVFLGRTSNAATYCGTTMDEAYINVTPTGSNILPLTLKCDYTLVPTDGAGEKIHVKGATASVPAAYIQWASNHAYTYIFKISDQTTGGTGTATDPAGLYPITFDAVVVGDAEGLVQETVSTVTSATITTYQKGTAITDNGKNMYGPGNVYVVVDDNGVKQLKVGKDADCNISLFIAAPDEDTDIKYITESVVARCFEKNYHPTTDPDEYEYTETTPDNVEINMSMTLANESLSAITEIPDFDSPYGKDITVNGAMFPVKPNTMYVIQYKKRTNPEETDPTKYEYEYTYKVLNVGDFVMLSYINYTANGPDDKGTNGDIYYAEENYWGWGVCDMLQEGSLQDYMSYMGALDIPVEAKASFGGAELDIAASREKSKKVEYSDELKFWIIEGKLVFDRPVTAMDYSFCDVNDLRSIELPSTLKRIGPYAFEATSLSTIKIPKDVETIGVHAFECCNSLETVDFSKCTKLSSIGTSAFESCNLLNNVVLPNSLRTIGNSAFQSCVLLKDLELNEGLETIKANAFQFCDALKNIVIPSTVTKVESNIVSSCQNLETIYLPEYMTGTLDSQAFMNWGRALDDTKEMNVFLYQCAKKNGDLTIDSNTFGWSEVPNAVGGMLVLPRNLSEIKGPAFIRAPFSSIVFLSDTPPTIHKDAFINWSGDIYVPSFDDYKTRWTNILKDEYQFDSDNDGVIDCYMISVEGGLVYVREGTPMAP